MKKKVLTVLSSIAIALAALPTYSVNASENLSSTLIKTEQYELKGESFEVETWQDQFGIEMITIPTDVVNKVEVAEFVTELYSSKPKIQPYGIFDYWSKSLYGEASNSANAVSELTTSGYTEHAFLFPATAHVLAIDEGDLKVSWLGAGYPDKIVITYNYNFSATSLTISYPPSLELKNKIVSYTSLPVEDEWYVLTTTEAASGQSRTFLNGVTITAGGDIYKGSYIYKPRASKYVSFEAPYL